MAKRQLPPQGVLRQLLSYDPKTGKLFWKERGPEWFGASSRFSAEVQAKQWNTRYAGKEALSCLHTEGYLYGRIEGQKVFAHRVIWKLVHGDDPEFIDHVNSIRSDNRLENLRSVSRAENARNLARQKRNRSGVTGVFESSGNWTAHIRRNGKYHHIGVFPTIEEAAEARRLAEVELGYAPTHGRKTAT